MFADAIMLCSASREAVKTSLEKWLRALEKRVIKVESETQYMAVIDKINGQLNLAKVRIKKIKNLSI